MRPNCKILVLCVWLLGFANIGRADIILDYTHNKAVNGGSGFFDTNATAKAALEKAVSDLNQALNLDNSLSSISAGQNDVVGTNGISSSTAEFTLTYTNPESGAPVSWRPFSLGTDEIRIFVGMRNLSGNTLGQGGLGGFSTSVGALALESELVGAVADMESQANAIYGRGHGPKTGTISGSLTLGSTTANYSIEKGVTHGNLWFDSDTDNDGSFDTPGELDDSWHFDHTTDVDPTKIDFYSVALHEIMHAIGYGGSDSWDELISGTEGDDDPDDWLGAFAIAENGGTGVDLIDDGHGHIKSGTLSTSIVDGLEQEAVMTPSISNGERRFLTHLDIAFLKDIGYTNAAAVPEPASLVMVSVLSVAGFGYVRRRRKLQVESNSVI